MSGPNWLNDPAIADELRDRGHHYDLWELDEANGRLSEMGRFSDYEQESRYIRPEDLIEHARNTQQSELTVQVPMTCKSAEEEELPAFRGTGTEIKLVVFFYGTEKGLVLNSSMIPVFKELTGDDLDRTNGVKIALFLTTSKRSASGYTLRVRPAAPGETQQTAEQAERDRRAAEEVERRRAEAEAADRSTGAVPDDEIPF